MFEGPTLEAAEGWGAYVCAVGSVEGLCCILELRLHALTVPAPCREKSRELIPTAGAAGG